MHRRINLCFCITAVILMSLLLFACGKSGSPGNEKDENTIMEPAETIRISETVFEFPVAISENRKLTVCLHLEEVDGQSAKEVLKAQIFDGEELLQIITKHDVPKVTDYDWEGLFLNESNKVGLPDVRDLNFDGAEDFGLLAVCSYPPNVPYSYFFWNEATESFTYQFTAFGPGWLQCDASGKRLVEVSMVGTERLEKTFTFDQYGNVVAENE